MADLQRGGGEVVMFTGGGRSCTVRRKGRDGREELKILGGNFLETNVSGIRKRRI
jgi:hypothetical protein